MTPVVDGSMKSLAYNLSVCPTPYNLGLLFRQPKVWVALSISVPCGCVGGALKFWQLNLDEGRFVGVIKDESAYASLTFIVVFLAAFRIDAAYGKFWDGCSYVYNIGGDLFDGAADLVAFTRCAKADQEKIQDFHQILIRLVSLIHALICADLDRGAGRLDPDISSMPSSYGFEIIDVSSIDDDSMSRLLETDNKVECVFQWIQNLIVEGWHENIFGVGAPCMTRAFEDLGAGLVHFHEAQKITEVPFPFPYMMALQLLLVAHWLITPIVTAEWTNVYAWAFGFSWSSTFSLWFFVGLAMELDMPFNYTRNSLDMRYMQKLLNDRLLTIIATYERKTPGLSADVKRNLSRKSLADTSVTMGFAESLERLEMRKTTQALTLPTVTAEDHDAIRVTV